MKTIGDQQLLKRMNRSVLLRLLRARPGLSRARLASAEQQALSRQMRLALASAQAAEAALPRGSPDWLRAQDIAFQARAAIESDKKRR